LGHLLHTLRLGYWYRGTQTSETKTHQWIQIAGSARGIHKVIRR
jgi:hypothetical protein